MVTGIHTEIACPWYLQGVYFQVFTAATTALRKSLFALSCASSPVAEFFLRSTFIPLTLPSLETWSLMTICPSMPSSRSDFGYSGVLLPGSGFGGVERSGRSIGLVGSIFFFSTFGFGASSFGFGFGFSAFGFAGLVPVPAPPWPVPYSLSERAVSASGGGPSGMSTGTCGCGLGLGFAFGFGGGASGGGGGASSGSGSGSSSGASSVAKSAISGSRRTSTCSPFWLWRKTP